MTRKWIAVVMVAVATATGTAQAQGRGMGRHRGEEGNQQSHKSDDLADQWSGRFADMATTKPVLKDVKVEKSAKDSIGRIEKTYKERFRTYVNAAKRTFDEAKAQSAPPNFAQLDTLMQEARQLQDQEFGEVRALLAADQRATFDANIVRLRSEEDSESAKRRS